MISFLLRHIRELTLLSVALLGLTLGYLGAAVLGFYLTPPLRMEVPPVSSAATSLRQPLLKDYEPVLRRNIFDSRGAGSLTLGAEPETAAKAAPAARPDLALLGTVMAGKGSLAVLRTDQKIGVFRLGEEIPGGGRLDEVVRNEVRVCFDDGSTLTLSLYEEGKAAGTPPPPAGAGGGRVQAVGENSWVIPRIEAERARENINELLKQARMVPNIVDGRTEGFSVQMVRPNSFIAMLGIQRGDVIMEINGTSLDSPEKALQIFQQLREARNIDIGLVRNGARQNFSYEVR